MKYTEEMILHSESGYSMPFEEPEGKDVELSLGYGEQADPATGEKFFHHGIDFNIRCYMLSAIASGIVSGVGNDPAHGICQTIRYGEYEVTYGHLSNVFAQFGQRVKAGQTVALSGDRLHLEVRFKGEELNPIEFLTMLYGNIRAMRQAAGRDTAGFSDLEMTLQTDYEKDKREIEGIDAALPATLYGGSATWRIHIAGTYGAIAPQHLHDGRNEGVFLRAYAEYGESARAGTQGHASCLQGSEPTYRGLSELPRATAQRVSLHDGRRRKKKLHDEALASGGIIDPLAELDIDIQSFDIPRMVTVYPDRAGIRWWTKAWFNNREEGETSVEIEREQAIRFIQDNIEKDAWLEMFFPRQMEIYHNAIEQTKEQLLKQINI